MIRFIGKTVNSGGRCGIELRPFQIARMINSLRSHFCRSFMGVRLTVGDYL